jgi:hypothetical protein
VRLQAEIAAANERILAARHRAAEREASAKEALRTEIVEARNAVAEMEHRHQEALAIVRDAAQAEVERILTDARRVAAEGTIPAAHSQPDSADVD